MSNIGKGEQPDEHVVLDEHIGQVLEEEIAILFLNIEP